LGLRNFVRAHCAYVKVLVHSENESLEAIGPVVKMNAPQQGGPAPILLLVMRAASHSPRPTALAKTSRIILVVG
jgi:hypothetical protein